MSEGEELLRQEDSGCSISGWARFLQHSSLPSQPAARSAGSHNAPFREQRGNHTPPRRPGGCGRAVLPATNPGPFRQGKWRMPTDRSNRPKSTACWSKPA